MSVRELFEGCALQAVDEKGRVAIPADLRAAVERNSDVRTIVIGLHPFDPCLSAHDLGWSQEKFTRIDDPAQSPFAKNAAPDTVRAKRGAFGAVERAPFDSSGRFVLPPFFRMKAAIGKWAFFIGSAETFDIWSPEALLADNEPDNEAVREMCRFFCQSKGVVL